MTRPVPVFPSCKQLSESPTGSCCSWKRNAANPRRGGREVAAWGPGTNSCLGGDRWQEDTLQDLHDEASSVWSGVGGVEVEGHRCRLHPPEAWRPPSLFSTPL